MTSLRNFHMKLKWKCTDQIKSKLVREYFQSAQWKRRKRRLPGTMHWWSASYAIKTSHYSSSTIHPKSWQLCAIHKGYQKEISKYKKPPIKHFLERENPTLWAIQPKPQLLHILWNEHCFQILLSVTWHKDYNVRPWTKEVGHILLNQARLYDLWQYDNMQTSSNIYIFRRWFSSKTSLNKLMLLPFFRYVPKYWPKNDETRSSFLKHINKFLFMGSQCVK